VKPGASCAEVHETARRVIGDAGYGDYFNHGTGHGVGVEIHEEPRFRSGFGGHLEPGNVVTIEPGVYLPERFGVRIEDLVVVTEDGHEVLSRFPKSLLDVGCYDGQFISSVLPREREKLVGLDVSQAALAGAASLGLVPVRAQVEATLPFASDTFATVVAGEVIEHVFDTQAVVHELTRVLQPGGWLALTTPNLVALSGRAQLILGRSPHNIEFDASPGTSGHIRYFTFDTLER